ncbi:hypothetical protein VKT23_018419 [Stygiomarasmius scandens]|uniref:Uncharacterized protein n=1 Tax=Marasmiellus scandens TaxID=2682957 RepID=A0ABR1IS54_9AGAR
MSGLDSLLNPVSPPTPPTSLKNVTNSDPGTSHRLQVMSSSSSSAGTTQNFQFSFPPPTIPPSSNSHGSLLAELLDPELNVEALKAYGVDVSQLYDPAVAASSNIFSSQLMDLDNFDDLWQFDESLLTPADPATFTEMPLSSTTISSAAIDVSTDHKNLNETTSGLQASILEHSVSPPSVPLEDLNDSTTAASSFHPPSALTHAELNHHLPMQHPRPRNRPNLTDAQKQKISASLAVAKARRARFMERVMSAHDMHQQTLKTIAEEEGFKFEMVEKLLNTSSHFKSQRNEVSKRNALMHYVKVQGLNEGNLRGGDLHHFIETNAELQKLANDKDAMAKLKQEVLDYRNAKSMGARVSPLSAAHDIRAFTDTMAAELNNLYSRTGALSFFMVTPGGRDDKGRPGFAVGGVDTMAFFRRSFKQEPWDILADFQMYRAKGDKRRGIDSGAELRAQCVNMISSGLRYTIRAERVQMNYENYETAIVQRFNVKLIWPEDINYGVIANPTKLPMDCIRKLHRALEIGTCKWVEISAHEKAKRMQEQGNSTAEKPRRKERSDKGQRRGSKKRPREDENDDSAQPRRKSPRKPTQKKRTNGGASRGRRTAEVYKSSEFIDDNDDVVGAAGDNAKQSVPIVIMMAGKQCQREFHYKRFDFKGGYS